MGFSDFSYHISKNFACVLISPITYLWLYDVLHLFPTGIYLASTQLVAQKHLRLATRLTSDYLDQTFTGKLITACRTHDFHPLERAPAGRRQKAQI